MEPVQLDAHVTKAEAVFDRDRGRVYVITVTLRGAPPTDRQDLKLAVTPEQYAALEGIMRTPSGAVSVTIGPVDGHQTPA